MRTVRLYFAIIADERWPVRSLIHASERPFASATEQGAGLNGKIGGKQGGSSPPSGGIHWPNLARKAPKPSRPQGSPCLFLGACLPRAAFRNAVVVRRGQVQLATEFHDGLGLMDPSDLPAAPRLLHASTALAMDVLSSRIRGMRAGSRFSP